MEEAEEKKPLVNHCPECGKALDVGGVGPFAKITCPHCEAYVRVRTTMGQYQIVGLLGEGGMSQVFRAVDMNLGREVALKILHQSLSRDRALTSMFEREAKLTASVIHPNVVKVYTVGNELGYFFIAMELVHATSLEDLIGNKGALAESEVLAIALDVTRGLKAAHGENLIHRDIKPGNMLVTDDGTTKLVDFGLAVHQGGEDESEDLWATPFYVPPEKLEGDPDTFLGDLYSLGATLYHALAGKPPFEANTSSLEELKEIKKKSVDLKSVAPGVSRQTVRLVEKMMAYAPADRFPSYDEAIARIEEVRTRQFGIHSVGRVRRGGRGKRQLLIGLGVAVAVLVALALVVFNGDPPVEGDLELGNGERVISAGDSTITDQFLGARTLIAKGNFGKAKEIFDALIAEPTVPAATKIWSHYFCGMIQLYAGDAAAARESFLHIQSTESGAEDATTEATAFTKTTAVGLAASLPLLGDEADFTPGTVEVLGLLTAGLKNWQSGEFESGVDFLNAFVESNPPEGYEWIERIKSTVPPFLKDFEVLKDLPNPSAAHPDALAEQEDVLKKASESLRTRGAAPRLVEARLARLAEIRAMAATPAPASPGDATATTAATTPPTGLTASEGAPGTTAMPTPNETAPPAPPDPAELDRLKALVSSLQDLGDTLRFSEAIVKLEEETVTTEAGRTIRAALIHGYEQAGRFLPVLAEALGQTRYEGVIRRRVGNPIEAAITGASDTLFIVDLGFGPNEVEVGIFAPDWLVETAGVVFPPLAPESAEAWESAIFFALMTGHGALVEARADELAAIDPEFAKRWEAIRSHR
ncbi:MAG: serine/threonine protein kinase [Verrucomicrobiaceae bacterium]|nr:serine/threonine protein kinase [Verrucomicrobiaceae bacterium]